MIEDSRLVIEFTQMALTFLSEVIVPLAWPVIALIAVLLFKSDIRKVADRIRELPGGTKLDHGQADRPLLGNSVIPGGEVSEAPASKTTEAKPTDQVDEHGDIGSAQGPDSNNQSINPALSFVHQLIDLDELRSAVIEKNEDLGVWFDITVNAHDANTSTVLFWAEAACIQQRRAFGEFILRTIYRSQLLALERVVHTPTGYDDLQDLFRQHKKAAGDLSHPDIYSWVNYLIAHGLMANRSGRLETTEVGQSFFSLFLNSGLNPNSFRY